MVKWTDIGESLKDKGNRIVSMEIEHEGRTRQVTIIPEVQPDGRAIMGITPYVEHHETTMTEAIAMGMGRAADLLHMMTAGLYDMVTGLRGDAALHVHRPSQSESGASQYPSRPASGWRTFDPYSFGGHSRAAAAGESADLYSIGRDRRTGCDFLLCTLP